MNAKFLLKSSGGNNLFFNSVTYELHSFFYSDNSLKLSNISYFVGNGTKP